MLTYHSYHKNLIFELFNFVTKDNRSMDHDIGFGRHVGYGDLNILVININLLK